MWNPALGRCLGIMAAVVFAVGSVVTEILGI